MKVLLTTLQLVVATMFLSTGGTASIVCPSARVPVACACLAGRRPRRPAAQPPASSPSATLSAGPVPRRGRTCL